MSDTPLLPSSGSGVPPTVEPSDFKVYKPPASTSSTPSYKASVFIAVESLYSMDGTIAPLARMVECVEQVLPLGNGYMIVDEAHATDIYSLKGRGLVADLGLEKRIFVRLHTYGKALASSGAVLLTAELVKDYLLNYLIYTTTLPFANIVAINCSFDMFEDGTAEALSTHLLDISTYFVDLLRSELKKYPSSLLSLPDHLEPVISDEARPEIDIRNEQSRQDNAPSNIPRNKHTHTDLGLSRPMPIIPILTPEPRSLSSFLLSYAASPFTPPSVPDASPSSSHPPIIPFPMTLIQQPPVALHTKPIFPPTVPKGTARVRICLHAAHTREDVALLARGIVAWAERRMAEERRERKRWEAFARDVGVGVWMEARL